MENESSTRTRTTRRRRRKRQRRGGGRRLEDDTADAFIKGEYGLYRGRGRRKRALRSDISREGEEEKPQEGKLDGGNEEEK